MICRSSTRFVCYTSRANFCQTCLPAVHALRFTPSFTRHSHQRQLLPQRCYKPIWRCCATWSTPDIVPNGQDDVVQRTTRPFQSFIRRQALVAVGALLLAALLIRPLAKSWSVAHKPVPDALPAAVWLPRPTSDQLAKQHAHGHNSKQAETFAAISSSIPATSSRLLRISDALLMQLTVALQQVRQHAVYVHASTVLPSQSTALTCCFDESLQCCTAGTFAYQGCCICRSC